MTVYCPSKTKIHRKAAADSLRITNLFLSQLDKPICPL